MTQQRKGRAIVELQQSLAEAARRQDGGLGETIVLNEYIERVEANPLIAQTAHERVFDMIEQAGMEEIGVETREISFNFFADELFGLNETLARIVGYFESAAQGHETRKRILLAWGPPGGAKSSLAAMLKRGLEAYSHTDRGAVYAIVGCPMHEEPLRLIPEHDPALRRQASEQLKVKIEGSLCPVCQWRLANDYGGDFLQVPIERIFFSETRRVGIGTFEPSDPKSMSMEQLTGGINFRAIEQYGSDDHPLVLDWSGEFMKANRGIFEAVEFFKNPREFLFAFLSLAQERQFKVPKFGYIPADIAVIAHTNEAEFRAFMSDQKNEALRDRLFTISVPYNVRLDEEQRIYEKLLTEARGRAPFHVAPNTLETAAMIAVLSRLESYEKLEPIDKMKLYAGKEVGEWKLAQVPELKRAAESEGMKGLGPRRIIDILSSAAVKQHHRPGQEPCLSPIQTIVALKEHIEKLELAKEERERLLAFITDVRKEIDQELKDEVRKAFIPAFAENAQELLENYLNNVEAYTQNTKLKDPITGEEVSPDEKLMRAIEEQVGVADSAKDAFRQGVLVRIGIWMRKGRPLTYKADEQLGRAIEAYLFNELSAIVRVTVSKTNPDPEQAKRLNEVLRVMIEQRGYCSVCASEVLDYVGALLNR